MTDKQVYFAFSEVKNYQDVDAFISDIALSSALEDVDPNEELFEKLRAIWNCYYYSVQQISKLSGMNQTELATRFMIPLRTVQHWFNGDREIPLYLKILICENLGLWRR